MNEKLTEVKEVLKSNFVDAPYGIFFCRNTFGDRMTTLYSKDGVMVDICYGNGYFEVFGLSDEEERELEDFYHGLYNVAP